MSELRAHPRRTRVVFSGGGTGGHLQPALALADALQGLRSDVHPFFVGAERGIEARILPERGLPHLLLPVEGFRRRAAGPGRGAGARLGDVLANLAVLARLGQAMARLVALFHRLRPALVVVTGGYAGGPAGLVALVLRIPLVLQEQNARPGLVTRALSVGAREVQVAFPEVAERLPAPARRRVRVTGNPVRLPDPRGGEEGRERARRDFGLPADGRPVVLVVGGSQGSRALNEAMVALVRAARARGEPLPFQLLWSTGPAHLDTVRAELGGAADEPGIALRGYIDDMEAALALAALAVSRAGAMATAEFLARGLPSLLVPLPTAAADHQTENARALEAVGAALCLPEAALDGEALLDRLGELVRDEARLAAMARAARRRGRPEAAREMARALAAHLPPPPPGAPVAGDGATTGGRP